MTGFSNRPRIAFIGYGATSAHKAAMIQALIRAGATVEYVDVNGDKKSEKIVGCKVDGMVIDEFLELHAEPLALETPHLDLPKHKVRKPYFRQNERW